MNWFRNQYYVGLDIGQAVTKAVRLKFNGKTVSLTGWQFLNRRDEGIIGEQELSRELRPWLERAGWHHQEITVGIPQYVATAQISDFSAGNERNLEDMVAFETQQLAGLSEEAFLHDYQPMNSAFGRRQPVLIGICRESVITERAESLTAANLRFVDFTIAGPALAAAYVHLYPTVKNSRELHLVVDIGAENSTVVVIGQGNLLYSSSLMCGTDRYFEILAGQLGIPVEEAEKQKNRITVEAEPAAAAAAAAIFEAELRSVISQWRSEEQTEAAELELTKLCLCGGGARIRGLATWLGRKLECPSAMVGVPDGDNREPALMIAYGLALQGTGVSPFALSLAPLWMRRQAHRRRRFPLLAVAVGLLAGLLVTTGYRTYREVEGRQRLLEAQLSLIEQSQTMVPELDQMVEQTQNLERLLLPYVQKGNNLHTLRKVIELLGEARAGVSSRGDLENFADAWIIYLADGRSFDAGKTGSTESGRRPREPERRTPINPFSEPQAAEDSQRRSGGTERGWRAVTELTPWSNFVIAVYTVSPPGGRYEQVRQFIELLNRSEALREVDLMPGPATVGREDIFMPWLQMAAHESLDYRRFVIELPLTGSQ